MIAQLKAAGKEVIALVRDAAAQADMLQVGASSVVVADALNAEQLAQVVRGAAPDTVVSLLGAPPKVLCGGPDYTGNKNLVDAAKAAGVRRFVLVSALGVGDSLDCIPHASQDVLKPWLDNKGKAEEYLQESGLEYVIMRPGPLSNGAITSPAVLSVDAAAGRAYSEMSRVELGRVVSQVTISAAAANKVLCVLDPGRVVIAAPFLRAMEPWESLPFTEFAC